MTTSTGFKPKSKSVQLDLTSSSEFSFQAFLANHIISKKEHLSSKQILFKFAKRFTKRNSKFLNQQNKDKSSFILLPRSKVSVDTNRVIFQARQSLNYSPSL